VIAFPQSNVDIKHPDVLQTHVSPLVGARGGDKETRGVTLTIHAHASYKNTSAKKADAESERNKFQE
jgi:hypothetical protein